MLESIKIGIKIGSNSFSGSFIDDIDSEISATYKSTALALRVVVMVAVFNSDSLVKPDVYYQCLHHKLYICLSLHIFCR